MGSTARSVLAFLAICSLGPASTVTLFDSTGGLWAGADSIAIDGPLYASFSTAPGSPVYLSNVSFDFEIVGASSTVPIVIAASTPETVVGLYSDNSLSPGSLLTTIATIPDSSFTSGIEADPAIPIFPFDISVSPTYELAPDTRYWIGFSSVDDTVAGLEWTDDSSGTGVAGEYSVTQGTLVPDTDPAFVLQITAQTGAALAGTPEPRSGLLSAAALLSLLLARRKRRNS